MQQVNPLGFRLGSSVGWQGQEFGTTGSAISWQLNWLARKAIARRGSFLINAYTFSHRQMMFCVLVYYCYHQRSRLQRWLVGYLNRREGVLAPPKARYFVLYKTTLNSHSAWFNRRVNTKRIFPRGGLKGRSLVASRSWKIRGWVDLEFKTLAPLQRRLAYNLILERRDLTSQWLPRSTFRAHNIFEFIGGANPLVLLRHYILQRFSKMLYQADLLSVIYLATQLNLSRLLAHSILLGLERHAGRRQQRRFLSMVRTMFEHIVMWKRVQNRPLWRVSIFGKLDAKMRRTHMKMRIGFIRYQEVDFLTDYTSLVSRSKFGTTSVRIWMRNLLN